MLYLLIGFLLGLAAAAFWRFLGDCLTGWMDEPALAPRDSQPHRPTDDAVAAPETPKVTPPSRAAPRPTPPPRHP